MEQDHNLEIDLTTSNIWSRINLHLITLFAGIALAVVAFIAIDASTGDDKPAVTTTRRPQPLLSSGTAMALSQFRPFGTPRQLVLYIVGSQAEADALAPTMNDSSKIVHSFLVIETHGQQAAAEGHIFLLAQELTMMGTEFHIIDLRPASLEARASSR
jgi:hypothetical protein